MIDLRSDTVTRPTAAMYAAMAAAELGDDGREGDPTTRRLEQMAAARTGKEDALFVVSGTMGNLVALAAHDVGRLVVEASAHLVMHEQASLALARMEPCLIAGERGVMDLESLGAACRAGPAVIALENTHNHASGAVLPVEHLRAVRTTCEEASIHLDGARLFNAAVALGVDVAAICEPVDSVTFCLSKGLSAPVGALVCGTRDFIDRARRCRQAVGGTLRQSGVVAAAGIVALETMVERLAEDHARAQRLARGFDPDGHVDTNIVRLDVSGTAMSAPEWRHALADRAMAVNSYGEHEIRMVTHRHVGDDDVERVIEAVEAISYARRKPMLR